MTARRGLAVKEFDYYLSNAEPDVALDELARVAKAAHRIGDAAGEKSGPRH